MPQALDILYKIKNRALEMGKKRIFLPSPAKTPLQKQKSPGLAARA